MSSPTNNWTLNIGRALRVAAAVGLMWTAASSPALAVCVIFPLEHFLTDEATVAIFSGVVKQIEKVDAGQVVTFEVERVWKGDVRKQTVVYNKYSSGASEQILFVRGTQYLVKAYRPNSTIRSEFGLPADGDVLASGYCMTDDFNHVDQEAVGRIPNHPPR